MKIGRYIVKIVPIDSYNFELSLPYFNYIFFNRKKDAKYIKSNLVKLLKKNYIYVNSIKSNSGIQYSILGKYWIFLIIKELK